MSVAEHCYNARVHALRAARLIVQAVESLDSTDNGEEQNIARAMDEMEDATAAIQAAYAKAGEARVTLVRQRIADGNDQPLVSLGQGEYRRDIGADENGRLVDLTH